MAKSQRIQLQCGNDDGRDSSTRWVWAKVLGPGLVSEELFEDENCTIPLQWGSYNGSGGPIDYTKSPRSKTRY